MSPKTLVLTLLAAALVACQHAPALIPVSAGAEGVRVESADPPVGANALGEVEGSDGKGCGIGGDRGSLENATRALQQAALRRGASFVKLTEVTKPYSGHDCYHQEFKLRGEAYALPGAPPPASAATALTCSPPCSPGYACNSSGACVAECNPPCGPLSLCRSDRVCVPAPPAP